MSVFSFSYMLWTYSGPLDRVHCKNVCSKCTVGDWMVLRLVRERERKRQRALFL